MAFLNGIEKLSSRARHLYALKSFFQYVNREEIVTRLKAPSAERELKRWLSPAEVASMIQRCHLARDRAVVGLGYTAALRNGELSLLDRTDIVRDRLVLEVRSEKKRGRLRVSSVPLYWSTLELLDAYLKTRNDSDPALFLNCDGQRLGPEGVNGVVKRAMNRAGIQVSAGFRNLLRHARASHLRLRGVALEDVRELLRHERLETSLIYAYIGASDLAKRIPEPELHLSEVTEVA